MVRPCLPALLAAVGLTGCGDPPPAGSGTTDTTAASGITTDPSTTDPTTPATSNPTTSDPTPTSTTTTSTAATTTGDPQTTTTTTGDPSTGPAATTGAPCEGLECQVDPCGGDPSKTVLRGTVVAPEGTLPLYNVTVFVPNAPLAAPPDGVQCDTCSGLDGDPVVAALTDTSGEFVLTGVPAGQVPLVVTVGKWRRESLVQVTACADNLAPAGATRLPRNQAEGHLPKIAVTTGGADPFECLLRKLGLDDAEFTPPAGPGRVHLYAGAGGGADRYTGALNGGALFPKAPVLWDSLVNLMKYDMVLMACEGNQYADQKSQIARENIVKYAGVGGRLFFTHWHNVWIEKGPAPWPTLATFKFQPDLPSPSTGAIDTSFPKGQALADWMVAVGGSQVAGALEIKEGQHTIDAVDPTRATRWIYTEAPLPSSVQHLGFNAPVDVAPAKQCGRVVDSDIHVSSGDTPGAPFPSGCTTKGLTPQEKVLAFMFFELAACVIPDDQDPIPG